MTLPAVDNITLCQSTEGHLCKFDTALYPTDTVNWFIYTLLMNDGAKIKTNCRITMKPQSHKLAYNLIDNGWAISSIITEEIQV